MRSPWAFCTSSEREEANDSYTQDIYSLDPVYQAKAKILNDALQEIGMGKYQWHLFLVAGLGWTSDELWQMNCALIDTSVTREFNVRGEWMLLASTLGLLVGTIFWGVGCDVWGRRWSFNFTILISAVFALIASAAPNYVALCACIAGWSFGVGGNLPVDSAVFLEFSPASHQYMLTVLSVFWSLGDLLCTSVAWPLISNFSCPPAPAPCPASSNKGWRYHLLAMGGIMMVMWIIRFFVFNLQESPKYLMGRGRDEDAVAAVHRVAVVNGKISTLTVTHLKEAEMLAMESNRNNARTVTSVATTRKFSKLDAIQVSPLFATRKLAYSTSILIVLWALIGFSFPLYDYFLAYYYMRTHVGNGNNSLFTTYRNEVIAAFLSVPAALMAGYLIEVPIFGRRGTLAIFTLLTGVFVLASTTAHTSNAYEGWICGFAYTSTIMYGVLVAMSPELFPTKSRGTGNSIVFAADRVFGVLAPIIALHTNVTTPAPMLVAGVVFLAAGFVPLLLPIEPRGKASL
ncbi:major facilitator superfamily domain-containing protein, partial [Scleroderma yunnanense]